MKKTPPKGHTNPQSHVFTDWGVAVYHTNASNLKSSYFSFKSSKLRGAAMFNLAQNYKHFIQQTNPGHEHPDQNSFTIPMLAKSFNQWW